MQDLICPKCGDIGTNYYTEMKAHNNVARCLICDTFIKNIPQGSDPTFYFGKYKDKKIVEVDDLQYLKWVLGNVKVTATMRGAIEKQISRIENLGR